MMKMDDLARRIDHTNLRPEATASDIRRLCEEAVENGFFSVCVNSSRVAESVQILGGSGVKVAAVAGFPLGAMGTSAKVFEVGLAVEAGAGEVDIVQAIGHLKGGELDYVYEDLRDAIGAAGGVPVKVILETCLLTEEEKLVGCRLAVEAGAAFVKTSTGFCNGGATVSDVGLLARAVAGRCEVKAAGGIRDTETAMLMLAAGATRLGTSNGVAILKGVYCNEGY